MVKSTPILGYAIALAAITTYMLLPTLNKKFALTVFSPSSIMFFNSIAIGLLAYLSLKFTEKPLLPQGVTLGSVLIIFGIGALNFLAFYGYLTAVNQIPIAEYQLIGVIGPMIATFFAFLLLGEKITTFNLIGYAIVLVGLYVGLFMGKN